MRSVLALISSNMKNVSTNNFIRKAKYVSQLQLFSLFRSRWKKLQPKKYTTIAPCAVHVCFGPDTAPEWPKMFHDISDTGKQICNTPSNKYTSELQMNLWMAGQYQRDCLADGLGLRSSRAGPCRWERHPPPGTWVVSWADALVHDGQEEHHHHAWKVEGNCSSKSSLLARARQRTKFRPEKFV